MHLEHLGIAVSDAAPLAGLIRDLLGRDVYKTEVVEREGVRTHFISAASAGGARPPKLELLEATSAESPVSRHIERRGEGMHHLAFEVGDIRAAMQKARELGIRVLADEPKAGADGKVIAFLHPRDTHGVLIELCESIRTEPEWQHINHGDGSLAVQISGPEGAPPLLVLHGALGSTELETDRLVRHWEQTFRVYALDFEAHGRSSPVAGQTLTFDRFTDNASAVLEAFDLHDVRVFGFSMGGGVALFAALRHPDRISRFAVHGVNVQWDEKEVRDMVFPMAPERMEAAAPRWAQRLADVHGADNWRDLVHRMIDFTRHLPNNPFPDELLQRITQPTLVSTGDSDRYFPLRHAFHLRETLPNARLWVIPGLDHPIQGVDAEAFSNQIANYLLSDG